MVTETSIPISKAFASTAEGFHWQGLLPTLERLDHRLEQAIAAADRVYGPEAATDPYRGLHIDPSEVAQLLRREPGVPLFAPLEGELGAALADSFAWLQDAYGLSAFDLDVIVLALASELDRRYERLYAYLQDHVSRRRPSVDLALNLLCANAVERLQRRSHFDPEAPLIRQGLIHLIVESEPLEPTLLAHTLKLDDQVVRFLLGQGGLDRRLASFCRWVRPSALPHDGGAESVQVQALLPRVVQAWNEQSPLRLYFQGPAGVGKQRVAIGLAAALSVPLLTADLSWAVMARVDLALEFPRLFREARLQNALLYLSHLEVMQQETKTLAYSILLELLGADGGITLLAGSRPWTPVADPPLGVVSVPFPLPDGTARRQIWQQALAWQGLSLLDSDLAALAGRFRLTPAQIGEAVAIAHQSREVAPKGNPTSQLKTALFAAARQQSGQDLATLARKIEPLYRWEDLVLPQDALAQLQELCQRVAHRHQVLEEWGFDRKLSLGKGVNALFAGPSGTGKTMAAEVIAQELGLDLCKIDLSGVVSKYIGETEKNLNRIFRAAENANAILFFDEADALFGKRSAVRDSHDRYANIEISYLLQKMEEYEGLSILATNLHRNMDEAFIRRLTMMVVFPLPDESHRQRIWQTVWPPQTPLDETVDLADLAQRFKLTGGNIKNIALTAAYLAAAAGSTLQPQHLFQALRREYQKMGKSLSEAELKGNG